MLRRHAERAHGTATIERLARVNCQLSRERDEACARCRDAERHVFALEQLVQWQGEGLLEFRDHFDRLLELAEGAQGEVEVFKGLLMD